MGNSSRKVFVSHASRDKDFVNRLVSDLAARGVSVWYDKLDVRLGDSIPGKINSGISEAKYFLIVLSLAAIKSKRVQEELNAALMRQVASASTFLLPVLIEDYEIGGKKSRPSVARSGAFKPRIYLPALDQIRQIFPHEF